jgi:hypothetical protein
VLSPAGTEAPAKWPFDFWQHQEEERDRAFRQFKANLECGAAQAERGELFDVCAPAAVPIT